MQCLDGTPSTGVRLPLQESTANTENFVDGINSTRLWHMCGFRMKDIVLGLTWIRIGCNMSTYPRHGTDKWIASRYSSRICAVNWTGPHLHSDPTTTTCHQIDNDHDYNGLVNFFILSAIILFRNCNGFNSIKYFMCIIMKNE